MDLTSLSTKSLAVQTALLAPQSQNILDDYVKQVLLYIDKVGSEKIGSRNYEKELARATSRKRSR